jgi:hypothetical protein
MTTLLLVIGVLTAVAVKSTGGAEAATTTTYSATETIPVPPTSSYGGSGGGDGWAVALSSTDVYNVFHHSDILQVACHLQSDGSACWNPETITDGSGNNFATSGQPGLYLNQATGHLYVYATRTSDSTGGVVCIDTTIASTNSDPFCGFTALTAVGDAPPYNGISAISDPVVVSGKFFAFNYVNGSDVIGTQNSLLCFDLTSLTACASQPFSAAIGSGTVTDQAYPPPAVATIAQQVVVPITVGGTDELACFDGTALKSCSGAWPVAITGGYDSDYGAPFPLLSSSGIVTGLCLPSPGDPCYTLAGAPTATPVGMTSAIAPTIGWNGPAFVLGARVYVPDGNADAVDCYDYDLGASCANFPKTLSNLDLLYTVNPDPQRPTCIWVNSDNGTDQIQNFDAYTGGACGQGPIRVLASSLVAPGALCVPASYSSLQVLAPAPSAYTNGTVGFEDGDGNPITSLPAQALDVNGSVALTSFNLSTEVGLPQFLITLNGVSGAPASVEVKLSWTGASDPSCTPVGQTAGQRFVVIGDSVAYGHGLNNPYVNPSIGTGSSTSQGPSTKAWPSLVSTTLGDSMSVRPTNCTLAGDQLSISGAQLSKRNASNAAATPSSAYNYQCSGTTRSEEGTELPVANLSAAPASIVAIQGGADDIDFGDCLLTLLSHGLAGGPSCVTGGQPASFINQKLTNVRNSLTTMIETVSPHTNRVLVLNYYDPLPQPTDFNAASYHHGSSVDPICFGLEGQKKGASSVGSIVSSALNSTISQAVTNAKRAGIKNVTLVDISKLEVNHEMCTGSPAIFSGEFLKDTEFAEDLDTLAVCGLIHRDCGTAAYDKTELQRYTWRAAHPNQFGQQDIAKAVLAALGK